MANEDLKIRAQGEGVCLWEIADELQITDATFSRRLRHELDADEKERINGIIAAISKRKKERK